MYELNIFSLFLTIIAAADGLCFNFFRLLSLEQSKKHERREKTKAYNM